MTAKEFESLLNLEFNKFRRENKNDLVDGSKYFNEIGSTLLEDIPYKNQISIKLSALKNLLEGVVNDNLLSSLELVESPTQSHYRFKAEFVTCHNPKFEPYFRFGQRKKNNFSWVVDINEYYLLDSNVFNKARKVFDFAISKGIIPYDLKTKDGDLRYITVKHYKNESMLILTINGNENLFDSVVDYAMNLGFSSVYLILNNSNRDTNEGTMVKFVGKETITIPIKIDNNELIFSVGPFTFFQNNIACFELLLNTISNFFKEKTFKDATLYDLYSGSGLFGISFADKFNKVIGIDVVEENIQMANKNVIQNNINNAEYICEDLNKINLSATDTGVVIVDPPRSGLEDNGVNNVLKINAEYLIYVSCNPVTLAKDLNKLKDIYQIQSIRAFDTFPQTYHMECLCIMKRV